MKIESANERSQQIHDLCLQYCSDPNENTLAKIAGYLGDFATNLRSALNYTMVDFRDRRLKSVISKKMYRSIKSKHDFPCYVSKDDFDSCSEIIRLAKQHCLIVYDYLERLQPYHSGNEWLRDLLDISNTDKHEITVETKPEEMEQILSIGGDHTEIPKVLFFGDGFDKMLLLYKNEKSALPLPQYFSPYGGYAIKGGHWLYFLVPTSANRFVPVARFTETIPQKVVTIIDGLTALL